MKIWTGAFIFIILGLFVTGCQVIANQVFTPPSESSSSCVGNACQDIPHVTEGFTEKWTNRGNRKVAIRVSFCNGATGEKILNPGEEYAAVGWCNNYLAYYGELPSGGSETPAQSKIVSFEIEPAEVLAEQPTEYNLKYKVTLDGPAKAESYVYFIHELISGHIDSINGRPEKWLVKIGNTGLINAVRTMKKEPSVIKVTAYNSVSSQSAVVTVK